MGPGRELIHGSMRIAEIYPSIQGEGRCTGTPSVFVRTSGCNLRCGYCDTPYASWSPEGDDLSIPQIRSEVLRFRIEHVVLTGGEPMLFSELVPLCQWLRTDGLHITIETAGTLYLSLPCDLMSISPKLSNSTPSVDRAPAWRGRHEVTRHQPDVVRRLIEEYDYQLKFVIARPDDLEEVEEYLEFIPAADPDRVMLMPEGTDPVHLEAIAEWLRPYCSASRYRFCARQHIEWFGGVRGT